MPWEKQFDIETALEKAGETFWTNGYQATSMRDLMNVMGIQKGSFYDTYGSKKEAYLMALDQYINTHCADFRARVEQHPPKRALEIHLNDVFEELYRRERSSRLHGDQLRTRVGPQRHGCSEGCWKSFEDP